MDKEKELAALKNRRARLWDFFCESESDSVRWSE